MYCPKCGTQLPDNSAICSNCGEKLSNLNMNQNDNFQNINNNTNNQEQNGLSITSLILSISFFVCIFFSGGLALICSVLAIIFGAIGRKKGAKGIGTAGMIIGIIGTVILVIIFFIALVAVMSATVLTQNTFMY